VTAGSIQPQKGMAGERFALRLKRVGCWLLSILNSFLERSFPYDYGDRFH
jgi:hypothetical protein